MSKQTRSPQLGAGVFIAPNAMVIGNLKAGEDVSFWFGVSARGDYEEPIEIGDRTNVQDGVILHGACKIGSGVTVGHGAVVHGCVVEDDVLVGIKSVILDGAVIGTGSIVAAGAVVTENFKVPPNSLVAGVPAKIIRRDQGPEQVERIRFNAKHYVQLKNAYMRGEYDIFTGESDHRAPAGRM